MGIRRLRTMNKKARIYVAGHGGLVGSSILQQLKDEGYKNLIFRTSKELDLRNQEAVGQFFATEKIDFVFLAAANVGGIYANNSYPADFIRDNIQIQTNVIDSAYRYGIKKLLFLGSSCIYPKLAAQPLKEEYLLSGSLETTNEWYAIAKIAGIKMCQAYRRQFGFNAISIMPTNLYGAKDNFDLENSHVLPALIRKFHLAKLVVRKDIDAIREDEEKYGKIPHDILKMLALSSENGILKFQEGIPKVMLWGTGKPRREFMHVDDVASASIFLMEHYDSGEIINIGVGEDIEIRELARVVQKIVGFEGEVVWDSSKPDGTPRKLMDVSKVNACGWEASILLESGIQQTYQNYIS